MRTGTKFILIGAALVTLLHASPLQGQESWSWSGGVDRGDAVEIKGINGDIVAMPASGGQVEITARKESEKSDVNSVRIEVIEDSEGVLICAVYPHAEGKKPNQCGRGDDHRMSVNKNDVEVHFTVRVPAGVDFHGNTVNGNVTATELAGWIKAATVNGDVHVATSGLATAHTVNGDIQAELGSTDWDGEISFQNVNGDITVSLPAGAAADVEASTVNGDLITDFPLTVKGRFGPQSMKGQIGGGGETLKLSTVNGDVSLKTSG